MILARKVRIVPSIEQEKKLWKSVGTARFIYNWTLARQKENYRKYEDGKIQIGKEGENRYKCTKTNNIKKLKREVKLIQRRLSNIHLNHIHKTTTAIVKTKLSKIVIEDLNVKGMLKNKHLSKAIQERCFYKFISILEYKSKYSIINKMMY